MTLFEKNMDVGLYQLYDTPVEYDLTALKPEDIAQIEDWCIDNGIIVEFHVKGPSQKKFMLDISNNRWLPGTTGKYIVPHNLIFNENGSLTVLNHTYYHGSGQYMGGWTITSETTNILLPSWLKYKSKAVIRDAIRKFKGVSESAGDELFTPEQRKNNVIDLTMLRADDFILDDSTYYTVNDKIMYQFRFKPIPDEVMLPDPDFNGDIRTIGIFCDVNMEKMYITIEGFHGYGRQYIALNTYAIDRGLVHQGHSGEYHYGMDIRLPQWMFYRMKKEIKEKERQEAEYAEMQKNLPKSMFESNMDIKQDDLFGRTVDFSALTPKELIEEGEGIYGEMIRQIEYAVENGKALVTFQFQPNDAFMADDGPFDQGYGFPHINIYENGDIMAWCMNYVDGFEKLPEEIATIPLEYAKVITNIILPKWMQYKAKSILRQGGLGLSEKTMETVQPTLFANRSKTYHYAGKLPDVIDLSDLGQDQIQIERQDPDNRVLRYQFIYDEPYWSDKRKHIINPNLLFTHLTVDVEIVHGNNLIKPRLTYSLCGYPAKYADEEDPDDYRFYISTKFNDRQYRNWFERDIKLPNWLRYDIFRRMKAMGVDI